MLKRKKRKHFCLEDIEMFVRFPNYPKKVVKWEIDQTSKGHARSFPMKTDNFYIKRNTTYTKIMN